MVSDFFSYLATERKSPTMDVVKNFITLKLLVAVIVVVCGSPTRGNAQTETVKNSAYNTTFFADLLNNFQLSQSIVKESNGTKKEHSIMLPSPSMAHSSPLFCRLEDKINEGNKIQCLFRLGSVSYVNYLEQKGDHQRLMLEQMR